MDRAADVGLEHRVDAAMLLDPAQLGELWRGDRRAEVIAAAVEVDDVRASARDGGLDALLELVGRRHRIKRSGVRLAATLREALDLPRETD
jgi:hypothetical protein